MNTDDHLDIGLGTALKEMADHWDTAVFDPADIAEQSRARTRRTRRKIATLAASACAVGAAVAVVVTTNDPSTSHPSPQPSSPDPRNGQLRLVAPSLSELCTPWTIEQAQASSPFSVMLPHVPLADPSSLTHVWNCGAGGVDVTEEFASGITIEFEHNHIADPGTDWRRLAASDPEETSVGTVQGEPAALIKPSADAVGSVTFVQGDTIIWVIGNGSASLSGLIDVADSLTR